MRRNKKQALVKQKAIVFDFDNTLCDMRAVEHLIDRADRWFRAFHERTSDCPPVPEVFAEAVKAKAEGKAVVICTARRRHWEFTLVEWFALQALEVDAIFMRADDDDREDGEMKTDLFREIAEIYDVEEFRDDRRVNIEAALAFGWAARKVELEALETAA